MLELGFDGSLSRGRIWTSDHDRVKESSSKRLTAVAYPEGDVLFAISKLGLLGDNDDANCSQSYFAGLRRANCDLPLPMCWDCAYGGSEPWKRSRHGLYHEECVSILVAACDGPLMVRVFASNMRCEFYARDKHGGPKQLRVGSGFNLAGYTSVMIDAPNVFGVEILLNSDEKASLASFLDTNQALAGSRSRVRNATKQN